MPATLYLRKFIAVSAMIIGYGKYSLKKLGRENNAILMYHRILPINKLSKFTEPGMYVTPKLFEQHLKYLKKRFKIVSLSELNNCTGKKAQSYDKPMIALTFDDGWCDFFEYAFPLLKRYNVPATNFLPTKFVGTREWFWTDKLLYMISEIKEKSDYKELLINCVSRINHSNKRTTFDEAEKYLKISELKNKPVDEINLILHDFAKLSLTDIEKTERAFLNKDEIFEMGKSKLIEFGSHTANHKILTTCSDEDVMKELVESKEWLLKMGIVNKEFIPFCYPNGNFTKRISETVKKVGYHMAVTTKNGWNDKKISNKYELKRIGIHEDMTSTDALFAAQLSGLWKKW